jgi:hypothetical protein
MPTTIYRTTLVDNNRRSLIKIVGTDGGDANTALIDVAKLAFSLNANSKILGTGTDRKSSYKTSIKRIWGQGQFGSNKLVTLKWADDTNSPIVTFGAGQFDYNFDSEGLTAAISTPVNANATGNIIFTSTATTGDAFTLFIDLKKDGGDYDQGQTRDPAAFNAHGI